MLGKSLPTVAALEIAPPVVEELRSYVTSHSAEHSTAKRAIKIRDSLSGRAPTRITETPYIVKKHDDIAPAVFAREAIGSRSNCPACHQTAEQGNYEEENVSIPR